eukprot:1588534-Prymnesium_polylepis.1
MCRCVPGAPPGLRSARAATRFLVVSGCVSAGAFENRYPVCISNRRQTRKTKTSPLSTALHSSRVICVSIYLAAGYFTYELCVVWSRKCGKSL